MHPFDHLPDTSTIVGEWIQYADSINQNYLDVCDNKNVLEIASGNGIISQQITKHPLTKFTMVDLGFNVSPIEETENIKFISEDIHQWLSTPKPMDVVVCFGLLYHLHSPLHLIELIVNRCNPEVIILDSVVAPHPLTFNIEGNNHPGSRQINNNWKSAPFNMPTPFFIINQSLDHMGYKLVKSHHLKCNPVPKSNSWVASWQKKLDNQI